MDLNIQALPFRAFSGPEQADRMERKRKNAANFFIVRLERGGALWCTANVGKIGRLVSEVFTPEEMRCKKTSDKSQFNKPNYRDMGTNHAKLTAKNAKSAKERQNQSLALFAFFAVSR